MKDLRLTVISKLSPPTFNETKIALKNSKARRKCIQASICAMLTEDTSTATE